MDVFYELLSYPVTDCKSVFTFGNFDGVHLGHQALLKKVVSLAQEKKLLSSVLTFSNHPAEILNPHKVPISITTAEQKVALIKECGIDICIIIPFTKEIAQLSPKEFIVAALTMVPSSLWVVGKDVRFGKGGFGDKEFLIQQANLLGFEVEFVEKIAAHGTQVSSSIVRALLANKEFEKASKLLGRS